MGKNKEAAQSIEPGDLTVQTLLKAAEALRSQHVEALTQLPLIQLVVSECQHDGQRRTDQKCQNRYWPCRELAIDEAQHSEPETSCYHKQKLMTPSC